MNERNRIIAANIIQTLACLSSEDAKEVLVNIQENRIQTNHETLIKRNLGLGAPTEVSEPNEIPSAEKTVADVAKLLSLLDGDYLLKAILAIQKSCKIHSMWVKDSLPEESKTHIPENSDKKPVSEDRERRRLEFIQDQKWNDLKITRETLCASAATRTGISLPQLGKELFNALICLTEDAFKNSPSRER